MLVLRTTIMTPVKPQISKFQADKIFAKWALTCYGGSTRERLLSESSIWPILPRNYGSQ